MIIDTHAHHADATFDADRTETLARARAAGVTVLVEIAEEEPQWAKARALAEQNNFMWWTAGIHPHHAGTPDAGFWKRLKDQLTHPRLVGVGEVGLDYFRNPVPSAQQIDVFSRAVETACGANKPLVLHCREMDVGETRAQEDMLGVLRKFFISDWDPRGPFRGVAHCFQGRPDMAREFMALGFCLGADGPLTYPNAGRLRELFAGVPLDFIVLETDSPYLPPQEKRGQRNESSFLPAVARALAALHGVSLEDVASRTAANARRLFHLSP
jgi:TatD DNase family protein